MCEACGKEEQAIDAELTKVEAAHPARRPRSYLGDRKAITWTPDPAPDSDDWVGDVADWRIRPMTNGEYQLSHEGESASFATLDWAMAWAEIYRIMEGPPGTA